VVVGNRPPPSGYRGQAGAPQATDSPYFVGQESQAMAREWYQQQFGVTFQEEQRKLTMHVIRRKP
jgi:hypothetical protein